MVARGDVSGFITTDLLVDNSVSLSGGYRLSGESHATADLMLGVVRHAWGFNGLDGSGANPWGVVGALSVSWAPTDPLSIEFRSEIERSGSFLGEEDLPEGYALKGGQRIGLSVGLRWHP